MQIMRANPEYVIRVYLVDGTIEDKEAFTFRQDEHGLTLIEAMPDGARVPVAFYPTATLLKVERVPFGTPLPQHEQPTEANPPGIGFRP